MSSDDYYDSRGLSPGEDSSSTSDNGAQSPQYRDLKWKNFKILNLCIFLVTEEEIEVADDSVVGQAIQKAQTFGQTESDQDYFSLSQSQGKGLV